MKIGIEDLPFAKLGPFGRLRFLDLHDHVGFFENLFRGAGYSGARCHIGGIVRADAGARLGFDQDLVAMGHIFAHRTGRQAHTVFMVFDFLRASDTHLAFLSV